MSTRTLGLNDGVYQYLLDHTLREPEVLQRLREETKMLPMGGMQISPEQGQFMRLLVELLGAVRCLEVGVFTGYSSTSVALSLPDHGKITACDVSEEFTSVARRYWREAGVQHKLDLRLDLALTTLDSLIAEGAGNTFDFAFIDADKENYLGYYERCLALLRPGGLIAVDNVLWGGRVVDPNNQSADTRAIRELNEHVQKDERVSMSLVPVGDGLLLARKRLV